MDWLTVRSGDFASPRLFSEVGNRNGDFGHGAGSAAGRTDVQIRAGHREQGWVCAGWGREKVGVGGIGEVIVVAGHVL